MTGLSVTKRVTRRTVSVATAAILVLLSGCATHRPAGFNCPVLADAPMSRHVSAVHSNQATSDPVHVLALSGGGPWGAFGAGFLAGWSQHSAAPHPARPSRFDMVTGISTGALMATYAFLGTEYDEALIRRYTNVADENIFKPRALVSLLWANSLATTGPLTSTLYAMITPEVIQAVAAAHAEGRKLIVGAVNLDDGTFSAFDLTALAAEYDHNPTQVRDCYVAAINASAAQPLAFPPVFINGHMYSDGGVRQTVFINELQDALHQQSRTTNSRLTDVTVIMNTDMAVDPGIQPGSVVSNRLPAILERTLPIAVDQIDHYALERIQSAAALNPLLQMRWTSAQGNPCDHLSDDPVNQEFKPKQMACLIEYGRTGIWEGTPWQ